MPQVWKLDYLSVTTGKLPTASVTLTRAFWLVTHPDLASLARVQAVSAFVVEAVKRAKALFLSDRDE